MMFVRFVLNAEVGIETHRKPQEATGTYRNSMEPTTTYMNPQDPGGTHKNL
jgi:hypothetical protein